MEHLSVIQLGKELGACTTDGTLFVCPLCPKQKSTTWSKIQGHFEGHMNTALHFNDKIICRCSLPCRDSAHYHCPFCWRTIIRKQQMESHIEMCRSKTTEVTSTEMLSSSPPVPNNPDHEYSLQPSTSYKVMPYSHRLPQRTLLWSTPERTPIQDHDYLLPVLTACDSITGSEELVETKAGHKTTLKMATCPHCALVLYKKNLATHIQRKHPQEKDVTGSYLLKSRPSHRLKCATSLLSDQLRVRFPPVTTCRIWLARAPRGEVKMAAQWSGGDGGLNPATREFTGQDSLEKTADRSSLGVHAVLGGGDVEAADTTSCVDRSILAIFDDSADLESKMESEEILLSALTEMLGCEEDEEAVLSPFDTLPDSELLPQPDRCPVEFTSARRLTRRRPKTLNMKLQTKSDRNKNQMQTKFRKQKQSCPESREPKAEVDFFSSTSLVSLVKLMHPYCLELRVEDDEDGARKRHPLFSREEVWKFKQPAEESDQEISVVSDEEEGGAGGGKPLLPKSVLLNGNSLRAAPSRQRKRVSFGPVHVALFDWGNGDDVEESAHLKSPNSSQSPAEAPPDPSQSDDLHSDALPGKSARKTRSLSLQEYRRLRMEGRPLLEKRRNCSTKWPTLSEAPKELTPILCFQGRTHVCRVKKSPPHPDIHHLSVTKLPPAPQVGTSTPLQPNPKVTSHLSPDIRAAESQKSPAKKPKLLCSDPPNPTLIPLQAPPPVEPPSVPRADPVSPQEPEPKRLPLATDKDQLHVADDHPDPESRGEDKERLDGPHRSKEPRPSWSDCKAPNSAADSGIEAADLTSLLQQFEQTQAMGGVVCESKLLHGPSPSTPPTEYHLKQDRLAEAELTPRFLLPCQPPSAEGRLQDLLSWGSEEVLCSEVILSTKQKNSASKPVQIIDPRPLPPKKDSWSAPPPLKHPPVFFASDHDYCRLLRHQCGPSQFMVVSNPPHEQWEVHYSRGGGRAHLAADTEEDQMLCGLPTPPPSPVRGRTRRRSPSCSSRSSSSSSCSSASLSPKRTRIHRKPPQLHHRTHHSSSRSRSWSRSRSRSCSSSPQRRRDTRSSAEAQRLRGNLDARIQKLRAIDERRVVYVGCIRRSMTPVELRERFSQFGEVESVSLHFRDRGDHYGFVTFYHTEDAFAAIDNGSKLRRPDELPFDICFGGRRQFCSSDYSDLDASKDADPSPPQDPFEDLGFDALLKQAQGGLQR